MPDAADRFLDEPSGAELLPATNAVIQSQGVMGTSMPSGAATLGKAILSAGTRQRAQFMRDNTQDAPLDTETGLSGWERLMYEFRGSQEAEIEALQTKYGKESVRLSTTGVPIVRVLDAESGKPKDILVDETKMTARDFAAVAGAIPEIAGAVGGFILGRKLPMGLGKMGGLRGLVRDVAAETAGAAATGVAEDVAIEAVDPSGRVDPGRIATERSKQAAVDATLGTAGVGMMRFFKWARNPFNSQKQLQFDALAAREHLKKKYGIDVPLTTGEASGNPYLAAQESFLSQQPTGKRVRAIKEKQNERILELQEKMIGAVPDEEAVGREAISTIQGSVAPVKQAERTARAGVQATGEGQVAIDVGMATGSGAPAPRVDKLGKGIRGRVVELRDAAKAESETLYEEAAKLPGGSGRIFLADDLSEDAAALLKRVPPKGSVAMEEFAPPDVINRLKKLVDLKGQKLSLSDLRQMRRDTYEAIPRTEGVPGRGAHYLSEIGEMLTKAMEKGVDELPISAANVPGWPLKEAIRKANKHYREKVVPFNRVGVSDLFRTAEEGGHIFDADVVQRVATDPGRFQVLKETLGETSADFSQVKRFVADDLLKRSSVDGKTLDAKSLFSNLKHFADKYPSIADDVFGKRLQELMGHARDLDVGQVQRIGYDELQTILTSKGPMRAKLGALYKAQKDKDELFKNSILKAVASDDLDVSSIAPGDFVTRFLDSASDAEVKQVLGHMSSNPALLDQIRAKTVERLFSKSSRPLRPEHVSKVIGGKAAEGSTATGLAEQLTDPKIRAILGPELTKDVGEFAKLAAAPEWVQSEFGRTGMFSVGNAVGQLIRKGPLKYVTHTAYKDAIVSWIITNPVLRAWARKIPPNDPGAWQVVLTSAPFMQMVINEFGEGTGADRAVQSIKSSVDRWFLERGGPPKADSQPTGDAAGDFLDQ